MCPSNWEKLHSNELSWIIFKKRAKILQHIREFFKENDYLEVEAPLLTPFPSLDSNIYSMETQFESESHKFKKLFLHTSPEHSMKKLLTSGIDKIFFLGKAFRNRELTPIHNPEFTLLEWYRTGANYLEIQNETETLIRTIAKKIFSKEKFTYKNKSVDLSPPWNQKTIQELFKEKINIDFNQCLGLNGFKKELKRRGLTFHPDDDWETLFYRIFIDHIDPDLGIPKPIFIRDYPMQLSLMAKSKENNPNYCERIELYIGGLEIANGYTELTDPDEQVQRFRHEQIQKKHAGFGHYTIDKPLLSALKLGIPQSAGIALGVDRLIMFLLNKEHIQDVLLFPFHQWMNSSD